MENTISIDYRVIWPDGSRAHTSTRKARSILDVAGKPDRMFGTVQDVTERKNAEAVLEKYRLFSENAHDIVLFVRRDGRILEANVAAVNAYGYTYDELLSLSIYDLRASDIGYHIDEQMDMAYNNGILFEAVHRRKDGSDFPVEVSSQGRIINGHRVLLSVVRDITERKQVEEALQVAKAQAELYVDLMGHDINNMNMVAMGTLEIALMDMEQDGKLDSSSKPLLDKSIESLKNSSALIRNVQKLQRASVEGIKLQAVDVADVLKGIIDEQRSTPGKDVTIYYKNEASHCLVTANELLRDVFTNIISNAIKHARTDRHLTIGVTVENIVEDGRKFCRVAIDDNGSGIPDEVKDRLFRRFSRGETKARGSGLGLYLVKTLVEHYGGEIRVEDRVPGDYTKGAKFVVMIPSVE